MIKGKTFFITGGAGFIGSAPAETPMNDNRAIIYDNPRRISSAKRRWLSEHRNVRFVKGDMPDLPLTKASIDNANIARHAAAVAEVDSVLRDPLTAVNVPEVYRQLPWFAFRPFNTASLFVALDVCTVGVPYWLADEQYEIHQEEHIPISVANHVAQTSEEFAGIMSRKPVTVVNVFDRRLLEPVIKYLIRNHLFSMKLLNFSGLQLSALEMLPNIYNLTDQRCGSIDEYLTMLTESTAVKDESTTVPTGA
jgi:hypothetical protein